MSIQVFILSKLFEDNNYPYKLKKQLSDPVPLDELGGLTESKLYYHFDTLAKKGLIEAVEIIKEEHRPDKQVFAITDKGRETLPKLIYKLFENANDIKDMLVAIANIKHVDRDKVVDILERKVEAITEKWDKALGFEAQISEKDKPITEFMVNYFSTKIDHTTYWLQELIKKIKQGEL